MSSISVGDLEKLLGKVKNKKLPAYMVISLCSVTDHGAGEGENYTVGHAEDQRFAITGLKVTEGPMHDDGDGPESDILATFPGRGVDISVHQNESLREH